MLKRHGVPCSEVRSWRAGAAVCSQSVPPTLTTPDDKSQRERRNCLLKEQSHRGLKKLAESRAWPQTSTASPGNAGRHPDTRLVRANDP